MRSLLPASSCRQGRADFGASGSDKGDQITENTTGSGSSLIGSRVTPAVGDNWLATPRSVTPNPCATMESSVPRFTSKRWMFGVGQTQHDLVVDLRPRTAMTDEERLSREIGPSHAGLLRELVALRYRHHQPLRPDPAGMAVRQAECSDQKRHVDPALVQMRHCFAG